MIYDWVVVRQVVRSRSLMSRQVGTLCQILYLRIGTVSSKAELRYSAESVSPTKTPPWSHWFESELMLREASCIKQCKLWCQIILDTPASVSAYYLQLIEAWQIYWQVLVNSRVANRFMRQMLVSEHKRPIKTPLNRAKTRCHVLTNKILHV